MRNVAPTKTNMLKLKEELSFARLGHELLDQKRSILVAELMALVDQATSWDERVSSELATAYRALEDASMAMGKLRVASVANAVDARSSIRIRQRRVMGVTLPVVDTTFQDKPPYHSPSGTSSRLDSAAKEFRDALREMGLSPGDVVVRYSSRELLSQVLGALGLGSQKLPAALAVLDKRSKVPPEAFEQMLSGVLPEPAARASLGCAKLLHF